MFLLAAGPQALTKEYPDVPHTIQSRMFTSSKDDDNEVDELNEGILLFKYLTEKLKVRPAHTGAPARPGSLAPAHPNPTRHLNRTFRRTSTRPKRAGVDRARCYSLRWTSSGCACCTAKC